MSELDDAPKSDSEMDQEAEDEDFKSVDTNNHTDNGTSNDSSSAYSDNETQEAALNQLYKEKMELIVANKYQYNVYVEMADIANKLMDVERVREIHELFSSVFPLTSQIWWRYIRVEIAVAHSSSSINALRGLFQNAFADYYSANLTEKYFKVAKKSDDDTAMLILEDIVSGLIIHCMRGKALFVEWLKCYNARVKDSKEKWIKIAMEYMNFLDIPHYGIDETYNEFKTFVEEHKDDLKDEVTLSEATETYNETFKAFLKLIPFEKQLKELDPKSHQERARIYQEYIAHCEKEKLISDYIQMLYERMVADCCLNASCWLNYMKFAQKREWKRKRNAVENTSKCIYMQQTSSKIGERAIENIPWSSDIWIECMRIVERDENSTKDIMKSKLEQALAAGFDTPEPMVAIWMEYLGYLRRELDPEDTEAAEHLQTMFDYAWRALGQQWGVLADCDCEILQFWGRLEYELLKNPAHGKQLWCTVMDSSDNASKSALWIEFANLECIHVSVESARRIFQKALKNHSLDNTAVIVVAWKRFERIYGSLDSLNACESHSFEVMEALNRRLIKQAQRARPEKPVVAGRKDNSGFQKPSTEQKVGSKRKAPSEDADVEKKRAKPDVDNKNDDNNDHAQEEIDVTKDNVRIFLSNLDYNVTENEIREAFPELEMVKIDIIKASTGRGRGYGYAELASAFEVNKALKLDNRPINNRPTYISTVNRDKDQRGKFKYSEGLEPTKLFVKGIPYEATKEDLEVLFAEHGVVKDIRIVYHKSGKSKGIAYIEYANAQSAKTAVLKLDEFDFMNHRLNVAISAPPPKRVMPSSSQNKLLKGLGLGQRGRAPPPGEAKPRMSFVPRVLQQKFAHGEVVPGEQNKTNDDFRKLLLK